MTFNHSHRSLHLAGLIKALTLLAAVIFTIAACATTPPPPAQVNTSTAVQQGVPPEEALKRITENMGNNAPTMQ